MTLFERVRDAAEAGSIVYEDDDGNSQVVPIMIRPRIIRPEQEAYFHASLPRSQPARSRSSRRSTSIDERVRELLPFTEREDRWLRDVLARSAISRRP